MNVVHAIKALLSIIVVIVVRLTSRLVVRTLMLLRLMLAMGMLQQGLAPVRSRLLLILLSKQLYAFTLTAAGSVTHLNQNNNNLS